MKIFYKIFSISAMFLFFISFIVPVNVSAAGPAPVDLLSIGTNNFSILAETGITNTGSHTSVITGNIGNSDGTAAQMDGVWCSEITGTIYGVDAAYTGSGTTTCFAGNPGVPAVVPVDANKTLVDNAVGDMMTAYVDAAGRPAIAGNTDLYGGNLGGQTFAPGLYKWNSNVTIPTNVTLSGGANDVWIFQMTGNLNISSGGDIASGIKVVLIGGAKASNVFWQVGGGVGATLGTYSTFNGNILSAKQIIMQTGAIFNGRAMAQSQVTLDANVVSSLPIPVGGGGGRRVTVFPLINVTKIPAPLDLPSGPGSVTYTFKVTNVGVVPVENITVKDDTCSPTTFISGDKNSDSILDLNESWIYECTRTASKTETNTVTACGSAHNDTSGGSMCDTANATVVVGKAVIPPLVHIVTKPSVFILPASGGAVTYSYTVTNPGTAPLSNVSVADNKCTGLPGRVVGHPGDLNKNNLLESNEVWSFVCNTFITKTTTNIGTAEGTANGLSAVDFSPSTVVVSLPALPKTGFSPKENRPWYSSILSSILKFIK